MAQSSSLLSFGIDFMSQSVRARGTCASACKRAALVLLTLVFAVAAGLPAGAQSSYVPPVVSSSASTVPTPIYAKPVVAPDINLIAPSFVAVDACGNIYTLDGGDGADGNVLEIPPTGASVHQVYDATNDYGDIKMGQDPTHNHLLVGAAYGTHFTMVPITGCSPNVSKITTTGGGSGALWYYYNPGYAAGDLYGNSYITSNGTCCVSGSYYLFEEPLSGNNGNIILANSKNEVQSMAIDKLLNVYYISGSAVFELVYDPVAKVYATPVPYGSYVNPVGLSIDSEGNLFVADSSVSTIYEIPNEGTAGPNLADQYAVASGVNIAVAVAVNNRGDMYYTASGAAVISQLSLGNANFFSVPQGQTATRVVNFQFNAAATITNIAAPTGDFSITKPALGTTACTTASYGGSNKSSCQVTVAFTPTAVGPESSALVVSYTVGGATQTVTGFVEGVGEGAVLTVDPGTLTAAFPGVKSPAGIFVDSTGNTYIADPGNNAVTEYPAGGGTAIPIIPTGSAPATFSGPLGVTADGAGNVFVADTGNNRVVEIPFTGGALAPASSSVIFGVIDPSAATLAYANGPLKNPSSVFANGNGDIYIADTGDNIIDVLPRFNGPTNAGSAFSAPYTLGTGLLNPLAVTVDGSGSVYIADSGNNQILAYPSGGGQEIVAADILNPSGLATDSSGALFVVDQGNDDVLRIPNVGGVLQPNSAAEVALGVATPYGVAVDRTSTLYVTDQVSGAAYTIARSQVGLNFGEFAVGVSSDPLPLTVESAGNLPLTFGTPYFTESGNAGDFAMTSPTGACADGSTLATGMTCDLSTAFTPTVAGARSATIAFTSNAANLPQLILGGTGASPSATTTVLTAVPKDPTVPLFYGEPLTFTATVAPTGSGTPTGSVSFVIDGVQFGLLPVIKGVAILPLNSGLPGGPHTAYAVYKGDTSNNGSSSTVQNITVARAPTTPVLTVTTVVYNNPYSIRHSNIGSCNVQDYRQTSFVYFSPPVPNDGIGFLASVTSPGVGVPSGLLTFYSDGVLINSKSVLVPTPTSSTPLLPASGGVFTGAMQSDANTLGDGTNLGENNTLVTTHIITVAYSGDVNYLPSTSVGVPVVVTDVSPTTPVSLPVHPVGTPPYCLATSTIQGSRPSDPSSFSVTPASTAIAATAATPGTVSITLNSLGGWNGSIDMACSNLPQYATCSFNPGQITLNASTPGNVVLPVTTVMTVTTNVPTYVPTANRSGIFWLTSLLLGMVTFSSRRRLRSIKGGLVAAIGGIVLFGAFGLSGCSTSSGSGSTTPAGTYPVVVTFAGAQLPSDPYVFGEIEAADVPYQQTFQVTVK